MNTTTALASTAGIVVLGRWAEGDTVSFRIVMGASFVAFSLSVMEGSAETLAEQLAVLILVGAFLRYGISIIKWTGLGAGADTGAKAAAKAGR